MSPTKRVEIILQGYRLDSQQGYTARLFIPGQNKLRIGSVTCREKCCDVETSGKPADNCIHLHPIKKPDVTQRREKYASKRKVQR